MNYLKKAKHFINNDKEFHLGFLPTEQSNPKTSQLSKVVQNDLIEGVKLLQLVDADMVDMARDVFSGEAFKILRNSLYAALKQEKNIYFSGCGATGRLCILLEASWRKFWKSLYSKFPDTQMRNMDSIVHSVMTGGDRALIRSVENFEDYQQFGRYQISQKNVTAGDVVVAVTEGGETSSVIGTALEGLEKGANVFFVFNNPASVLEKNVQRSRLLLKNDKITKIDLSCGSMAIAGSTRMQATSSELFVLASAMELALCDYLFEKLSAKQLEELKLTRKTVEEYLANFDELLKSLGQEQNLANIVSFSEYEKKIYESGGLITYFADDYVLDIFTDTAERAPTFTLPPFRRSDDHVSQPSWVFVKNPLVNTQSAWDNVFGRPPCGLTWNKDTYKMLGASEDISNTPPDLDNEDIYKFMIGNEDDPSRYNTKANSAILILAGVSCDQIKAKYNCINKYAKAGLNKFRENKVLVITSEQNPDLSADFVICGSITSSPLDIWMHLAIKLFLNTASTLTMTSMGRVLGNWMICAEATNKKLIDRGTRLVSEIAGLDYETACIEFHKSMDIINSNQNPGDEYIPPSAFTIYRLRTAFDENSGKLPSCNEILKQLNR